MNSYEETVIECCWNIIELWKMECPDVQMNIAIDRMERLISGGPDEFENGEFKWNEK